MSRNKKYLPATGPQHVTTQLGLVEAGPVVPMQPPTTFGQITK